MSSFVKCPVNRVKLFLDSHCYISLAALAVVVVHVLPRTGHMRLSLIWVGVFMMVTVVASGFFGTYVATTPMLRRNWRYSHLPYTVVFFLVMLPHMISQRF